MVCRMRRLVLGLSTVLLAAACADSPSSDRDRALAFGGPMAAGVLAPGSVKPGEVLGFAFPKIRNTASHPVTLVSLKVTHVPQGVRVLKYRFLSNRDTNGFMLGSFPANGHGAEAYDFYRDYKHPRIPAKSRSHFYGVVYVKALKVNAPDLTGCQVTYRMLTQTYTQSMRCDFRPRPVQPPQPTPSAHDQGR